MGTAAAVSELTNIGFKLKLRGATCSRDWQSRRKKIQQFTVKKPE